MVRFVSIPSARRLPLVALLALPLLAGAPLASTLDSAPETGWYQLPRALGVDDSLGTALRAALDAAITGETARARTLVTGILLAHPDSAPAQEVLGVIEAQEGRLDAAAAAFARAVEIDPQQATALTKLGDVQRALGDRAGARAFYERAIAIAPDDRHTHQRLGLLAEEDGDTAAAIRHFEAGLVGTPPEYLGIKVNLALLYNRTGAHDRALALLEPFAETAPGALVQRALANAHLGLGDAAAAEAGYRRALAAVPGDTAAQLGLGLALQAGGDPAGAVAVLAPLHAAAPAGADVALALARAQAAAGAPEAALAALDASLAALGEAAPELRLERARILQATGALAPAEAEYRTVLAAHPQALPAHLGLGALLGLQRRYPEAQAALAEGLAQAPDHPGLLRAAARVEQQLGNPAAALALVDRLEATGAAQPQDLFLRGLLHEAKGEPAAAIASYRRLLEGAPEFWPGLNNLAVLLTDAGAGAEALQLAEAARALAPDSPHVAHTLGWARLRAGDAAGGAPLLAEAVERMPDNAAYLAHLAEAEIALGQAEAARRTLDRARAAGLDPAEAAALEARLPR